MRILIAFVAGLLALGLSTAFAAEKERPRCENCGMFTDISSTTALATLKVDGKETEHNFVCLDCILEFNEREYDGKAELTALKIVDYPTFGTKSQKMIDGMQAFYLYDTKPLKGSMEPFIAAFATKDAAVSAQKTLGGDLLDFTEMWAKLASGEGEEGAEHSHADAAQAKYVCAMCNYETDKPGNCPHCGMALKEVKTPSVKEPASGGDEGTVYVCSCAGGCCDDIRMDKPGTCPNCSMELIPESAKN